jgi:hypothetical protein
MIQSTGRAAHVHRMLALVAGAVRPPEFGKSAARSRRCDRSIILTYSPPPGLAGQPTAAEPCLSFPAQSFRPPSLPRGLQIGMPATWRRCWRIFGMTACSSVPSRRRSSARLASRANRRCAPTGPRRLRSIPPCTSRSTTSPGHGARRILTVMYTSHTPGRAMAAAETMSFDEQGRQTIGRAYYGAVAAG